MFHALKGGLKLRNMTDKAAPYFPCRYLRRMIVAYMANNRDLIWKHKEASLRGRYGLEGGDCWIIGMVSNETNEDVRMYT